MPDTAEHNAAVARAWVEAFNRHDVDALIALYSRAATHTSPKIRTLHPETGGKLVGHAAIAQWWRDAIARLPGLRYDATSITANAERAIIEYVRRVPGEGDMLVAEVFECRDGRIVASRVYHG